MPALTNRDQYETAIVAALLPVFQAQYERVTEASSATSIVYATFEDGVRQVLADELFKAFSDSGAALVIGHSLVLSQGVFEDTGRRWAQKFAAETARQVTETSRRLTNESWKIGQGDRRAPHQIEASFQQAIAAIYLSPARLDTIAVTSVTAAASAGENAVVLFFPENRQRRLIAIWVTVESAPGVPAESVCPICAPLDRHGPDVWAIVYPSGPPGHPGCMCHREFMEAAEWARRAA